MSKLISIICTVKNGENTISQTIESVIKQEYVNWEFIIVDDGFTDNTEHILKEYAKNEKRLKVHFTGGIGRAQALNKAIKLSQGDYIANIDADDVMHPQKLEIQKNIMNLNTNLFLVSTESELFYDNKKPEWKSVEKHNLETLEVGSELLIRNIISHPSVLMNKEMLVNLGCYDESRKTQLDYELWLRALLKK